MQCQEMREQCLFACRVRTCLWPAAVGGVRCHARQLERARAAWAGLARGGYTSQFDAIVSAARLSRRHAVAGTVTATDKARPA